MIENCCAATHTVADGTLCSSCYPGYVLSDGECVMAGDDFCIDATAGTTTTEYTCNMCLPGYELITGVCTECNDASTIVDADECRACLYNFAQDECYNWYAIDQDVGIIWSCLIFDENFDCVLCPYGTNWDSTERACIPCDEITLEYYSALGYTEAFTIASSACKFDTWTAPELPTGDSGDSGDSAFTMLFNVIALVTLSLLAFFLV